jgi:hypothetical protein
VNYRCPETVRDGRSNPSRSQRRTVDAERPTRSANSDTCNN